ncbi:MAG: 16S rRNA (cytosine(1402)-N(4))-methyltransferase RsmH [Deltaproteobacteria bacterium]|nr:16S rRNA (cytosine(1402)-N(4))-methyltransferase RsmH [Deltaproteobacteria bacterium]
MFPAHTPVLAAEAMRLIGLRPGGLWIDATVGAGGHAALMLAGTGPDGVVIGIDRDAEAITYVTERFREFGSRFIAVKANFSETGRVMKTLNLPRARGILADLGVSSMQVDTPGRGFSLRAPGPLDMRMDRDERPTAMDLITQSDEETLAEVIRTLGEERAARRVARAIKSGLKPGAIRDTVTLAEAVAAAAWKAKGSRIHPATKTFQAIRSAVNREPEALDAFLKNLPSVAAPGGRAAVISFQSIEDRAVKRAFAEYAAGCRCPPGLPVCACGRKPRARVLSSGAVKPCSAEIEGNPRARSGRLRAIEFL